jgi:hypothetical protein
MKCPPVRCIFATPTLYSTAFFLLKDAEGFARKIWANFFMDET